MAFAGRDMRFEFNRVWLLAVLIWSFLGGRLSFAEERERSFRVLGYGDAFFEGIHFESENEDEAASRVLRFLPNQRSRRYVLPAGAAEVRFYRLERVPEGGYKKVEVGYIRLLQGNEMTLLVFFESAEFAKTGRYAIKQLDESPDAWTAGCFRFLNLTGAELACMIGERNLRLPLDGSDILQFDPSVDRPLRLKLSVFWQGENQTVLSTYVVADPRHPKLLVIRPPAVEGSLKVGLQTLW